LASGSHHGISAFKLTSIKCNCVCCVRYACPYHNPTATMGHSVLNVDNTLHVALMFLFGIFTLSELAESPPYMTKINNPSMLLGKNSVFLLLVLSWPCLRLEPSWVCMWDRTVVRGSMWRPLWAPSQRFLLSLNCWPYLDLTSSIPSGTHFTETRLPYQEFTRLLLFTTFRIMLNGYCSLNNALPRKLISIELVFKEWMGVNWAPAQKPNISMNFVNKKYKVTNIFRDVRQLTFYLYSFGIVRLRTFEGNTQVSWLWLLDN
jgi:hypothetical protein